MCEKQNCEGSSPFIRPLLLKRHSTQAVRNQGTLRLKKTFEKTEKKITRAASCASASLQRDKESQWQLQTRANQEDGRQRADEREHDAITEDTKRENKLP